MKRAMLPAAVALCMIGAPALAQGNPQSRAEARKTATTFSNCMVNQAGRSLRLLLKQPYSVAEFDREFARIHSITHCSAGSDGTAITLNFPRATMRGFLFDALYREDFGKLPAVTDFTAIQPLTYPVAEDVAEDVARPYLVSAALGDCVVRQAPAETRAFMLTRVETDEETAALTALAPAFQACTPAGVELSLTRPRARMAIAEPIYRLTEARMKP